jgi:hypothetical protein
MRVLLLAQRLLLWLGTGQQARVHFGVYHMPSTNRSLRQKLLGAAALALVSVIGAGSAQATVFGATATFTDVTTGNALTVIGYPNPATLLTPSLTAGHSDYVTGFMALLTTDSAGGFACTFGCSNTDTISLNFVWTQPSAAGNTTFGGTVEETTFLLASFDNGVLKWSGDTHSDSNGSYAEQTVTFSDGAVAKLDLYDSYITGTTSSEAAQFDIRLTDTKDPIPEPMSMALLGTGMLGLGMIRRRQAKRVAA